MTLMAERPAVARPPRSPVRRRPAGTQPAPPVAGARALRTLVWAVLALAVAGAVLAALRLAAPAPAADPAGATLLRTPYGSVSVGDVTVSAAVDASRGMVGRSAPGSAHSAHTGAASSAGAVRVNVPVTLSNQSDAVVRYTPEQFRLARGDGPAAGPEDSPLLTGELRPGAAVALRLTFALPEGATSTRLTVDGGQPAAGLDLRLPAAAAAGQQMTPQDQPAPGAATAPHASSSTSGH